MKWPPDRFNDNRWNRCLDATLEALTALELSPAADEPRDGKSAAARDAG